MPLRLRFGSSGYGDLPGFWVWGLPEMLAHQLSGGERQREATVGMPLGGSGGVFVLGVGESLFGKYLVE
jgi:hypothetical protein